MIDEAAKARDEQLVVAFAVILTHEQRFTVDGGEFWIERVDDRFVVSKEWGEDNPRETFDDVASAIRYFLDLCEQVIRP